MAAALHVEQILIAGVADRMRNIRAQYRPDKSTAHRHVYWSGSINRWISVEPHPTARGWTKVSYWATCPCSG